MTSSEFEQAAKKVVADYMKNVFGIETDDLQLVWFAHELGNKKCTLFSKKFGHFYPEVTYNAEKKEMYLDLYVKYDHIVLPQEAFA